MSGSLVFVTQVIDSTDPVLGFTSRLVCALSERCQDLVVIANEVREVPAGLGIEIMSLGKEDGRGKLGRGVRYQRVLASLARRLRRGGLVAHMCPTYLTLAAPAVKASGGRLVLWFAHAYESGALRRAERLADLVLTTFPGSYPRSSPKARPIGQAIDTDLFVVSPSKPRCCGLELVALGRTTPAKRYPVAIRAVRWARDQGAEVSLRIVGPSTNQAERAERGELDRLIAALGLDGAVVLEDDLDHSRVPEVLSGAHALVNTTSTGSADKVVFEAMACGRPPLVSSGTFADIVSHDRVRLRFRESDHQDLGERIVDLAGRSGEELDAVGAELRRRVEHHHSLGHWADEVVAATSASGTRS